MKDLTFLEYYRLLDDEKRIYGCRGDSGNGMFRVTAGHKTFLCIASNGCGWDHVSVSPWNKNGKMPTWDEMCQIKDIFFEADECVVQYHPAKADYVNNYETCLHLWKPNIGTFPKPSKLFV